MDSVLGIHTIIFVHHLIILNKLQEWGKKKKEILF